MRWRAGLPRGRLCQRVAPERLRSALLGSLRILCPLLLQDLGDCLLIGGLLLAQLLLARLPSDNMTMLGVLQMANALQKLQKALYAMLGRGSIDV